MVCQSRETWAFSTLSFLIRPKPSNPSHLNQNRHKSRTKSRSTRNLNLWFWNPPTSLLNLMVKDSTLVTWTRSCCPHLRNLSSSTNTKTRWSTTFLIRLLWNSLSNWSTWPRSNNSLARTSRFLTPIKLNSELTTGKHLLLCCQMIIGNMDFPTWPHRWSKRETWKLFCPPKSTTTSFVFSKHIWKEWKLTLLILLLCRNPKADTKSWMYKLSSYWRYAYLQSSLSRMALRDYCLRTLLYHLIFGISIIFGLRLVAGFS